MPGSRTLELRRHRRLICILALVAFPLLVMLYNMVEVEYQLPMKKFVLNEIDVRAIQRIIQNYSTTENSNLQQQQKRPLLVLFTTMQLTEDKSHIYGNTLRLWAMLKPAVLPVLLTTDTDLDLETKRKTYGWETLRIKHTFGELPIIRHMWLDVMEKFDGVFYAYANADILFDESLILTLQMLVDNGIAEKDPFIVGRRTNYLLESKETFHTLKDVRNAMTKPSAQIFFNYAEDYFITTRNGFAWKDIPDFVVARVGYDSWLVAYALKHHYYVIDATSTITCLHQSGSDGNYAGFTHKYLLDINRQLAGPGFDFTIGRTDCIKVETFLVKDPYTSIPKNSTKALSLRLRTPNPCREKFRKHGIDMTI